VKSLSKGKDGDSRREKEKGKKMTSTTSNEEKTTTFTLEDGTFIFVVEDPRRDNVERSTDKDGIPCLQVEGSIVYLRLGNKIALVSNGTICINDKGVCIDGEKIVIIHKDVTIYTPEGSATLYRSASDTPQETLVHGWKIYVVLRNKRLFIDSFAGWRQATVGTTYSGKFQFIEGIEYAL
jgi:hypothetical protein